MPPPERPTVFQRKLIIFPKIQIPLISWTAGLALIGALFTASFIVYSQNHLDAPVLQTNLVFGLAGLIIFSAYAILLSYYTNRLFGPLYRLQVTMKKMAKGEDVSPIRLRDGDHFADLIDDYNRMVELKIPKK
jgi:sensor histidine kinase YesM